MCQDLNWCFPIYKHNLLTKHIDHVHKFKYWSSNSNSTLVLDSIWRFLVLSDLWAVWATTWCFPTNTYE